MMSILFFFNFMTLTGFAQLLKLSEKNFSSQKRLLFYSRVNLINKILLFKNNVLQVNFLISTNVVHNLLNKNKVKSNKIVKN